MREILFRGKPLAEDYFDKWVFGDLRHGGYYIGDAEVYIANGSRGYLINQPVDPETVGQYTGLTDRKGKKIFEGDVCRFYGDEGYSDYAIFWDETVSQWTVRQIDLGAKDVLDSYFAECCEVIGNIHDNPDLLGGAEDGK